MTEPLSNSLSDAELVVSLLSIDPSGLGGVWVRARHGPARGRLERALDRLPNRSVKISPSMDDLALFGGLDVSESLLTGRPTERKGLIQAGATLRVSGVEAMDARRQTRLANAADGLCLLVLLDEGTEDDPLPHDSLLDRCAFFLSEVSTTDSTAAPYDAPHSMPQEIPLSDAQVAALATTAAMGAIPGSRPLLFAANAARALAILDGVETVSDDHLSIAVRLVFGHRAMLADDASEPENSAEQEPPTQSDPEPSDGTNSEELQLPQELLIDAMRTALPGDVLADIVSRTKTSAGSGRGDERISLQRGRPLPSRPGRLGGAGRPDILSTLSAAAPWQRLRGARRGQLLVRPEDIHVRRFREQSERLILFVVDASGSAALARLAEGKGAVELLLSRAYSERDYVSMVVFRDMGAELVLPPTRALARAKNALSGLAAGGATPLASGLKLALDVALQARRKGQTPQVVLISDGRANRTLDGEGNRALANTEANTLARQMRAHGLPVTLLDTGRRPSRELNTLSEALASPVIQLPRRMSADVGSSIAAALDGRN